MDAINAAIVKIEQDGRLAELQKKWFGATMDPPRPCPSAGFCPLARGACAGAGFGRSPIHGQRGSAACYFLIVWSSMPFLLTGGGRTVGLSRWPARDRLPRRGAGAASAQPVAAAGRCGGAPLTSASFAACRCSCSCCSSITCCRASGSTSPRLVAAIGGLVAVHRGLPGGDLARRLHWACPRAGRGGAHAAACRGLQIVACDRGPAGVRLTLPSLINEVTMMIKASSLISVVGIAELTRTAQNIAASTYRPLEIYVAAGVHLPRDQRRALARRRPRAPAAGELTPMQFDPTSCSPAGRTCCTASR